jgi:thiamine pyrophosphate-dependent acetolactate synthase large subunit-like protein
MNRFDLTKRLVARLRAGEAVIGGIGNTNFDLWSAGQRPENFYMLGSMGLAVPIGLGVALAQPRRRTFVLEGDGSLLMQLGTLGTVAATAPKNLVVVAFDNGMYQITGKQKSLTAGTVDLVAMAKGAGLAQSEWAKDEAHFEALVERALKGDGPWFIGAKIDASKPAGVTERDPALIRRRFMAGIAPRK